MVPLRQTQLKEMLEEHCRVLNRQVLRKIRILRDRNRVDRSGPVTDVSDDPAHEDIDFALAQMQAETRDESGRRSSGFPRASTGICEECHQEIPTTRLGAVPFATRCRGCQERADEVALRARRRSPGFARL